MTYQKPKVELLTAAIAAIQLKPDNTSPEGSFDAAQAYEDWE